MLFRFRGQCVACGQEWDGLRRRIECGRIDFEEPESHQCYSCARCVVELYASRLESRSSWLRWVSQNASEMTRSHLHFSACELGVTIDLQALEVIARSAILFQACERVSCILAGTRSKYLCASIDIGTMNCPDCSEPLSIGDLDSELLVCPACEGRSATWTGEIEPALVLVDYFPLGDDDVRRMVRHLEELAEPPKTVRTKSLLALPAAEGSGPLWDRQLDG
jgi:hypothetical protein